MESKKSKLRVVASGLCMATVMLVSILTGQSHVSGELGIAGISDQREHRIVPASLLDLNDPIPLK